RNRGALAFALTPSLLQEQRHVELTPGNLQALYTKYSQTYQEAFLKYLVHWSKLAMLVNSDTESETHVWMDRVMQVRKWVGDRVIRNPSLRDYVPKNDPFELT